MFSKELENLIKASLADGKLSELEKKALVKRAQKEGVDLDELEIYIESILQQRTQEQKVQLEKETSEHEKQRKGNICPHCATEIPPLTKICPNCNRAVNTNETSGDKELFELIDQINAALVEVKSVKSIDDYRRAAAECGALINKANVFYGDNKKVQMLVYELKVEIEKAEKGAKKAALRNQLGKRWKLIVAALAVIIIIVGIALLAAPKPAHDIQACLREVNKSLNQGNYLKAEEFCAAFANNHGYDPAEPAILRIMDVYIEQGKLDDAVRLGTHYYVVGHSVFSNEAYVLKLQSAYITAGRYDEAEKCSDYYGETDEYYDFLCACIDHMLETGKQSRVKNYIDRKVNHFDSSLSSKEEWQQAAVKKRLYEYAGL